MTIETSFSRRHFITGTLAASAAAALGLAGCAPQGTPTAATGGDEPAAGAAAGNAPAESTPTSDVPAWLGEAPAITDADCAETVDCEVLVIGAGCSGLVAANFAAMEGAKNLLIEKLDKGTGLRGSAIGAVGSRKQQEAGVNIDPQEICNDLVHYSLNNASMDLYQLASYSEEQAAWLLETGTYGIWVGNALSTVALCGTFVLDETKVLVQCEHICPLKESLEELQADKAKLEEKQTAWLRKAEERKLPKVQISAKELPTETVVYEKLQDQYPGRAGEIVDQLSTEELIALATGDPAKDQGASALGSAGQTVPGAAAETVTVAEKAPYYVASIVLADGPAGLRLRSEYQVREDGSIDGGDFLDGFENGYFAEPKESKGIVYHQYCTAIPVGTLLAQSWNLELMHTLGRMIAGEMNEFEVTLWLAPGMNIHRNPLCGRNFEYYSEDPLLAGSMAAAMTQGVQSIPGCGTTIKHFACNNQEDNRMGSDSILSERTLREIYLKGFETAIRSAQPMAMMTSYNLINGVHAANNYDICTKAARDEWGFAGAIMTDWTTTTDSTAGECTAAGCMKAGNDMVMPGDMRDHASIRQALKDGTLDIRELKRCVYHTIKIILQSNQYEDVKS